ncbi:MAG: hypothetical protein NVV60_01375 [Luteimonas sp.]|nr:hypothetical protein [Luteimonas sp.]
MLKLLPTGLEVAQVMTWQGGWGIKLWVYRGHRWYRIRPVPSRARGIAWANRWAEVNRERIVAETFVPSRLDAPFELEPGITGGRRGRR